MVSTRSKSKTRAISFKGIQEKAPIQINRKQAFLQHQYNKAMACLQEEHDVLLHIPSTYKFFDVVKCRMRVRGKYYPSFRAYYIKHCMLLERMEDGLAKKHELYRLAHELNTWTFTIDESVLKMNYAAYGVTWPPAEKN